MSPKLLHFFLKCFHFFFDLSLLILKSERKNFDLKYIFKETDNMQRYLDKNPNSQKIVKAKWVSNLEKVY